METVKWIFETDRHSIAYLRNLIESYDGMAMVRTIDPHQALIELMIAPGCEALIMDLLFYLKEAEKIRITNYE
jgi:hypothetical protein